MSRELVLSVKCKITCLSVSPCWVVLHRTHQNRKRPEKKGREPSGTEAWEDGTQEIVLLETDAVKETIMFINCNYPSTQVLNVTLPACAGAFCQSSCPFFQTSVLDLKEKASSLASSSVKKDNRLKCLEIGLEQKREECVQLENQLKKVTVNYRY